MRNSKKTKNAEGWLRRPRSQAPRGSRPAGKKIMRRKNVFVENEDAVSSDCESGEEAPAAPAAVDEIEEIEAWDVQRDDLSLSECETEENSAAAAAPGAANVDEIEVWSDSKNRSRKTGAGSSSRQPPLIAFPPLDSVSLRPGHVLEIVGPSGSGKTEILIQAAVLSVLPASCNGVAYGGSEAPVLFFDLDGRFDMSRFVTVLRARINEVHSHSKAVDASSDDHEVQKNEVLMASLRRFYRLKCFKSFELLAALRTLHTHASRIAEEHLGKAVQLLLIDGIGSFYWLDWMSSCAAAYTNRKTLGVQRYSELIVQELRRIRNAKLFLVLATKSPLYAHKKRYWKTSAPTANRIHYREYMPAAWQKFVTHRIFLQQPSSSGPQVFTAQWEKPSLGEQIQFVVEDRLAPVAG